MDTLPNTYYIGGETIITDENVSDICRTLRRLGSGASRAAYAISDTVVLKVGNGSNWAGSCESEAAAWQRIADSDTPDDLAYFAQIYAKGDGWLVMERICHVWGERYNCAECNTVDDDDAREFRSIMRKWDIEDMHGRNYGVRKDGTICAIDYAMNSDRYDMGGGRRFQVASDITVESDDEDVPSTCHCRYCRVARDETCRNGTFCSCDLHRPNRPVCDICGNTDARTYKSVETDVWNGGFMWADQPVRNTVLTRNIKNVCRKCADPDIRRNRALFGHDGIMPDSNSDIRRILPNVVDGEQLAMFRATRAIGSKSWMMRKVVVPA